eukprot:863279-Rhodomonas_salina.5
MPALKADAEGVVEELGLTLQHSVNQCPVCQQCRSAVHEIKQRSSRLTQRARWRSSDSPSAFREMSQSIP